MTGSQDGLSRLSVEYKELERIGKRLYKDLIPSNLLKGAYLRKGAESIMEFNNNLRIQLLDDGRKIFQNLIDIKKAIAEYRSSYAEQNQCKSSTLKEILKNVELAISGYRKEECKTMEELSKLESTLWQECSIFAENINLWEQSSSQQLPQGVVRPSCPPVKLALADSILPEVSAFQEYLTNNGGRTGGWKEFSHQTFLKIRRKYIQHNSTTPNGKSVDTVPEDVMQQFFHDVMSTLGLKSTAVVANHEQWFEKLIQLEAASKRALRERRLRQAETQSARRSSFGRETLTKPRLKSAPPTNRQQQRALLDAWREARQREATQKLEEERRAKDEEQRIVELRRTKHNEELKAKLASFRQKREQAISSARLAQNGTLHYDFQQATKTCLSQSDKDRIRERTNHLMQVKMERRSAKSRAQEEREMRSNRANSMLTIQVKRDPKRATGPTELWKIRVQALEDERKAPPSKPLLAAMASTRRQKALPEWRTRVSLA